MPGEPGGRLEPRLDGRVLTGPAGSGNAGGPGSVPRPLIGITTYREQARPDGWPTLSVLVPDAYPGAVAAAGGEPVLLPTGSAHGSVVTRLDGLLLTGGADVDPARYGRARGPHTGDPAPDRDASETGLLLAALAAGVPVLAVCRGLQVLNVALGGDLVQHLPDIVGTTAHQPADGTYAAHQVRTVEGSALARVLGDRSGVHCSHHQAVGRLGVGLRASAHAEDGTVEALEAPDRPGFLLGVQWHPEQGRDPRLFEALVAAGVARVPR